jgi:capsular exopolysaccharide synthesis family protein
MEHRPSQQTPAANANGSAIDARKLLEDFHHYKGIILRGWRFIILCLLATLTAAIIYIAASKPSYKASSRLLVIQQSGHPVHVGGANDLLMSDGRSDDNMATHLLLLKSPVIIEQALNLNGVKSVSIGSVIGDLTVKQPDTAAKIVDLVYKAKSADEAQRVLDGVIESYKLFLKSNYQKNSSEVISLITKARNELNDELRSLERAYLEYRQKNPAYAADSTGHTFVSRRLDQWDQALNQFSARSLQLQSQLDLGKKLLREGVDPASIANSLSQMGMIGGAPQRGQVGSTMDTSSATDLSPNDGSYVGIARELADVESRRKMAELYLEHLERPRQDQAATTEVSDREIEQKFLDDPDVAEILSHLRIATQNLDAAKRIMRKPSDPAIAYHNQEVARLKKAYERLWVIRRPRIAETLASGSNRDLDANYRNAQAEFIKLEARESALRDRLDEVATEELAKLRQQREQLLRQHGESHPLVVQLKQRIASIESQKEAANSPGRRNAGALIDHMTQSLQAIEAMRLDLQRKFDEDLSLSKKTEITLLEESNLRSNLERQRSLFNSVVDQLKQARLVSDYDSVSTQTIAPISVAADQTTKMPVLFLALIVGVGLGSGIAVFADLVEARVRTLAEIRRLVDLPLIGVIPFIRDVQIVSAGTAGLLSHHKPRSALAESYKTMRTNLEFVRRSRQAHVLVVASSLRGDGKTTTASNLAITMANTGRRVLLIDGDLRKPSLHRLFDVVPEGGLSDALLSLESMDRLIQPTFVNNLDLLTTGQDVSNPAELLASEQLGEILKELRSTYDMILIDSSPLLLVTDPSIIAAVADGIILVVKISSTRRHDLDVTHEMMKTLGVPVFGMVINGVTREEVGYGYGYVLGYGLGYGKKNCNPYGPSDEPPVNGNGSLPPAATKRGLGHKKGTSDPIGS